MRKGFLIVFVMCCIGITGRAEAGVLDWPLVRWTTNSLKWVYQPVNCPVNHLLLPFVEPHDGTFGHLWGAVRCVGDNLNRWPATLEPIVG